MQIPKDLPYQVVRGRRGKDHAFFLVDTRDKRVVYSEQCKQNQLHPSHIFRDKQARFNTREFFREFGEML